MYYDLVVFNTINGLAGQLPVLDFLGICLADYLPYMLAIYLLFLGICNLKYREMVFLAFASGIGAWLVKVVIVMFYQRPRPYINLPLSHKLIQMDPLYNLQSFPSGHALVFFAVSTAAYFYNKKLGVFFFVCAVLMGIARIFVGVHWPSDILAGAVLGILTACMINWIYKKYDKLHF